MRYAGRLTIVVAAVCALPAFSSVGEWHLWDDASGGNDHLYAIWQPDPGQDHRWTTAKEEAEAVGGYLATLNTKQEQDWLAAEFGIQLLTVYDPAEPYYLDWIGYWIGLTDNEAYGGHESWHEPDDPEHSRTWDGWVWLEPTGPEALTAESYTNWAGGYPYNLVEDMDFATMNWYVWPEAADAPGAWAAVSNDGWETRRFYGIVEMAPEPSVLVLLASGAVAVALKRRRRR